MLAKSWQPFEQSIYLNTETHAFTRTLTFAVPASSWPRVGGLRGAIASCGVLIARIPYDIILYLQEDYFINAAVAVAMLARLARLMQRDRISHISLVRGRRPGTPSQYGFSDQIDRRAQYRISAQAGLWRVSTLKSYLRRHENVWELELGTRLDPRLVWRSTGSPITERAQREPSNAEGLIALESRTR